MKTEITTKEQMRLNCVKDKFVFFDTKCECCNNYTKFGKMWLVKRWGANKVVFDWYYCHDCMPTKEDVLNEIDTDTIIFGIYPIDDHTIQKKDRTRLDERFHNAFPKIEKINKSSTDKQEEQIQEKNCICEYNGECKYKRKVLTKNN